MEQTKTSPIISAKRKAVEATAVVEVVLKVFLILKALEAIIMVHQEVIDHLKSLLEDLTLT